MLNNEDVTVTQAQINRTLKLQEQAGNQRREYDIAVEKQKERNKVYQRIIDLQRELRLAEKAVKDMEAREVSETEQPPIRKSVGKTLRNGVWVDV